MSHAGRHTGIQALVLIFFVVLTGLTLHAQLPDTQNTRRSARQARAGTEAQTGEFTRYGIFENSAPRAEDAKPVATHLPLTLKEGDRIGLIGNTLLERLQHFGQFEAFLQQGFPDHQLSVRNLAWSADTVDLRPRPDNFADVDQHLTYERIDVIFAAFGFNESFAAEDGLADFRESLANFLSTLRSKAFNGRNGPRIVLISPIANEDIKAVNAAQRNNDRIQLYVEAMREVAARHQVAFVDMFHVTRLAMNDPQTDLTINGCHLTKDGYTLFARELYRGTFEQTPPAASETLRLAIVDKNNQFFRRYRPLNTFYYTGGRSGRYGYLDFLPAMRNFEWMVENRDRRIWKLAQGQNVPPFVDDSNIPPLPETTESRGANRWIPAADELKEFQIDPRFEVNLFAGEEEFPDIAAPIQMRWDARGRLWVSCSTTYPHVYPGNEPTDKIVILEDTDQDGKADKSTVFADDLHVPLSFEFGDGGVYLSEQPYLTFLKDTDGDDRADIHEIVLSGFGTEDSHHALHDMTWTPDGDLMMRESIFHHSQVETPYGPVRQQNSGWFRYQPRTNRLISFGTYHSTNPWGVTFDDWGQHVASHPVYAAAFHALDPPYPEQHPKPVGLRAYSGTCGHEFVDFATFPEELQGGFIKARYKPTNRIEIHRWVESKFGFDEEYVSDLIFSSNLSFIPVDLRFGPRGALHVCDWYNPVKGHAQYSLRDDRRDRHSGRIWRITAKGQPLQDPPLIAGAPISQLLDILKRPEYRYRYWAKRELRQRNPAAVKKSLDAWVARLAQDDPRRTHHQLEAIWTYRWIGAVNTDLLRELLQSDLHLARGAATQQLRYWHPYMPDAMDLLRKSANDPNALVRMEAAIAASYIGTKQALDAMLDVIQHPYEGHVAYAIAAALGSKSLRQTWQDNPDYQISRILSKATRSNQFKEPTPSASQALFDNQADLKVVNISCIPERMLFSVDQFQVSTGQPVKIVFSNPDATDHNLVIVRPGALAEVGMAANEMAKDPRNARSDFVPSAKKNLIMHASPMIGPTRKSLVHVMRFRAPNKPGVYPFVCTFPGHWVVMNGLMAVGTDLRHAEQLLAENKPSIVKEWKMSDFANIETTHDEQTVMRGMQAFVKARCNQCHVVAGHGVNLGPDLKESIKKYRGEKLLRQLLEPSTEIHEKYQNYQILLTNGRIVSGVIVKDEPDQLHVMTNLLTPNLITHVSKAEIDEQIASKVSPMPEGLLDVLQRDEVMDLLSFIEAGGYQLPSHLHHHH